MPVFQIYLAYLIRERFMSCAAEFAPLVPMDESRAHSCR